MPPYQVGRTLARILLEAALAQIRQAPVGDRAGPEDESGPGVVQTPQSQSEAGNEESAEPNAPHSHSTGFEPGG